MHPLGHQQPESGGEKGKPGIACPRCGCRDLRVRNTRRTDHAIRRYRVCRHCGRTITTSETLGWGR